MDTQVQACQRPTVGGLLEQVSYLRSLGPEIIEALAGAATCLRFDSGAVIFLEGEPASGLYVVGSGVVKISRLSQEGREHILHLLEQGDTFNDVATMDGGPNPATAAAHSDAVVWHISRRNLQRIARRHPDLAWALMADMAQRARYLIGVVEDLAMRSVRGRLARLLLDEAQANRTDTVPRLLTQEEMAARLGTVREMVGRALRALADEGIIEFDRHRIVILDAEQLAREAEV